MLHVSIDISFHGRLPGKACQTHVVSLLQHATILGYLLALVPEHNHERWHNQAQQITNMVYCEGHRRVSRGRLYETYNAASAGPRSFLYFVVANVGPANSPRPLLVTLRLGSSCYPDSCTRRCRIERVNQVAEDCVRLFAIFTEPSNRTALEAELCLAAS